MVVRKPTNVRLVADPDVPGQVLLTFDYAYGEITTDYEVYWFYITESGNKFNAGTDKWPTIWGDESAKRRTWQYPSEAVKVYARIWCYPSGFGTDKQAFKMEWVQADFNVKANAFPTIPATPSVSTLNKRLVISLENVNNDTDKIQFQIVYSNEVVYATAKVDVGYDRAVFYEKDLLPNYAYRVRARAFKSSGISSNWSEFSSPVNAVPARPNLNYVKAYAASTQQYPTSIEVKWSLLSPDVENVTEKYRIEYTDDLDNFKNNYQSLIQSIETDDSSTFSILIPSLESGHEYYVRVAAVNDTGISDYSVILSAIVGATPTAPTTWSSVTSVKVGDEIRLYWVHNSVDGSSQTKARVYLSYKNGQYTEALTLNNTTDPAHIDDTSCLIINTIDGTYTYFNDTSQFQVLTDSVFALGGDLKWQVDTCGITGDQDYSDKSIQRQIDIYAAPDFSVTCSSLEASSGIPEYILPSYPINISAITIVTDSQEPLSYHLQIISQDAYKIVNEFGKYRYISEGQVIYEAFYDGTGEQNTTGSGTIYTKSISLSAGDVDLENGVTYSLVVSVSLNSALKESESIDFMVDWEDSIFDVGGNFSLDSENLSMSILPYCLDSNEEYSSDAILSVYRRNYDNSFTLIGNDISNGQSVSVVDPHPQLNYASYRIVAISQTNGGVSYQDYFNLEVGEKAVIIQWDESWTNYYQDEEHDITSFENPYAGSMLKLPYNIDISSNNSPDVTTIEYIGRQHPVSYYGTQLGETASWSVDIPKNDTETLSKIRELMTYMGDVYVREPSGIGFWANIKASYNINHCELVIPVSFEITRVEGGI